jgi:hypothetical protein
MGVLETLKERAARSPVGGAPTLRWRWGATYDPMMLANLGVAGLAPVLVRDENSN